MAKTQNATSKTALVVPMAFALLQYVPSRNYRGEPSGEPKHRELRRSMATMGWWNNEPIPVEAIADVYVREGKPGEMGKCGPHVGQIMPDFVAEAMQEREAKWAALKADTSTSGQQQLAVFVKLFTIDGDGKKLIKPEYLPLATFQRGSQFFASQVERYVGDGASVPGQEPFTEVPVEKLQFTDEVQRLEKQVLENEGRMIGNQPTSNRDKLRSARIFYQRGKNQNYFRSTYSSTTGQKLHGLLRLNDLWPSLRIYDRLMMNEPTDDAQAEMSDWIPYAKIKTTDLALIIRRTPAAKESMKPGESPITESEVAAWLKDLKKTSGNDPKVMGKDMVKTMGAQHPSLIVKDAMQSVLDNNADFITKYIPLSTGTNALIELAQLNHYPPAEAVLVGVLQLLKENRDMNTFVAFRTVVDGLLKPVDEPAATNA